MDVDRARTARAAHRKIARAEDSPKNQSSGLRKASAGADPPVHDKRWVRSGEKDASQLYAGRRAWWLASTFGARISHCARQAARSVPQRQTIGQLDLRRPLRA